MCPKINSIGKSTTGISPDYQKESYQFLSAQGISHPSLYGLEKEIRKMAFKGGKMRDLEKHIGAGYSAIRYFLDDTKTSNGISYYEIWKSHRKNLKTEKLRKRKYHCLKGKEDLILRLADEKKCGTEIAKEIGYVCSGTINSFLKNYNKYSDGRKKRRRGPVVHNVIDESVKNQEGLILNELSKLSGLTREGVRQYLIVNGIYTLWKKGREKVKSEKSPLRIKN